MLCFLMLLLVCVVDAQYGATDKRRVLVNKRQTFQIYASNCCQYRSDIYTFEMPSTADTAWKIWQDKLQELDGKLSARFSLQISLLKDHIDQLEKQVDDLIKVSTYDWKRADSGSLYKVFTEKKSFDDAQAICKAFRSHLAILDSEYKNKYVKDMLIKTIPDEHQDLWIGLKTKASMGSGSSYSNFAGDQPVEGCASMNHKGKWLIKDCDQQKPFVCQQINVR
ncbi:Snaclec bothrojaracin subunit alpha [Toxocara canis]|uniref:Snaclec bothrojaracin subunit alpha n=1 Tax=Toxocara canis TaxID=6265 RepID=A0A0B2VPT0_TOXCA|nr:Snaclec bothrojaracin subunit alpha [Toxocara canis]